MNAAAPHAAELVRVYDRINELEARVEALQARVESLEVGRDDAFHLALGREVAWEIEKYSDPFLMGVRARVSSGDGFTQNGEVAP